MRHAPGISLPEEVLRRRLPAFLAGQRWFGGKARRVDSVEVLDIVPMRDDRVAAELVLAQIHYADRQPDEAYCIPLLSAPGDRSVRAAASAAGDEPPFQDALLEPRFLSLLLKSIERELVFRGKKGEICGSSTSAFLGLAGSSGAELTPRLLKTEQSNSSVLFDNRFVLKLLRQARAGINPELEIGMFLTERARGARVPPLAGSIVYRGSDAAPRTLGILQSFVPNQGSAWDCTLRALADYSARVAAEREPWASPADDEIAFPSPGSKPPQPELEPLIGSYLAAAELLGQRTAELHHALASDPNDPRFAPEPFSGSYQSALLDSMRERSANVFELLRGQLRSLSEEVRPQAEALMDLRRILEEQLESFAELRFDGARLRIHGDYHLGQVLCSDGDFTIIDFEGEPARSLAERRTKHSPLQDVAGMLRSFHYAAHQGTRHWPEQQNFGLGSLSASRQWARLWRSCVSSRFVNAYLEVGGKGAFLPSSTGAITSLLKIYLLSKAIYELQYELNSRPDWAAIPLEGILEMLKR